MQGACRQFRNVTKAIPLYIRTDFSAAIIDLPQNQKEIIKNALLDFREKFNEPMLVLFSEFKVNCPGGVLRYSQNSKNNYPPIIYFSGLPLDSTNYISVVDNGLGFYLEHGTLAEKAEINYKNYLPGTELEFSNPYNSSMALNVISAK